MLDKTFFLLDVQLAFRSVTSSVDAKREQIRRILQLPASAPSGDTSPNDTSPIEAGDDTSSSSNNRRAASALEEAVSRYLRGATENFDLSKNVEVREKDIFDTWHSSYPLSSSSEILAVLTFQSILFCTIAQIPSNFSL